MKDDKNKGTRLAYEVWDLAAWWFTPYPNHSEVKQNALGQEYGFVTDRMTAMVDPFYLPII